MTQAAAQGATQRGAGVDKLKISMSKIHLDSFNQFLMHFDARVTRGSLSRVLNVLGPSLLESVK